MRGCSWWQEMFMVAGDVHGGCEECGSVEALRKP